jgi:hypothetical protein
LIAVAKDTVVLGLCNERAQAGHIIGIGGFSMKMIAFASALVLGASISGIAEAQTRRSAPSYAYIFAEYDHYSATGSSLNGGGIGGGWRFNRYFGA